MNAKLREILTRDHTRPALIGDACIRHQSIDLAARPIDCLMCAYEFRRIALHALAVNGWLDRWRTDVLQALTQDHE